jgi:hypothetical protein
VARFDEDCGDKRDRDEGASEDYEGNQLAWTNEHVATREV